MGSPNKILIYPLGTLNVIGDHNNFGLNKVNTVHPEGKVNVCSLQEEM